ncbi:MAG TPA: hypothetical protein VGF36_08550 [Rhodopila sp.]
MRAIQAYQPETRADCVNAGRTIAFSMAALALLGHAASEDMEMPEKLRVLGRANALNRSADQSERSMMQRRRYLRTKTSDEQPHPLSMPSEPTSEFDEAHVKAAMAEAINEYRAACAQRPAEAPAAESNPASQTVTPQPVPAINPLLRSAKAPGPTIQESVVHRAAAKPPSTSYRQRLMQASTMSKTDSSHPLMNMPPSIELPGGYSSRDRF